jgi:hypothetical protein
MMTFEEIRARIAVAINMLLEETPPLAVAVVHERSTAHRLAVHMEASFPGWNIDCEYDRDGLMRKELVNIHECDGRATDRILPDLIVHHRESHRREHNLLVIELKKDAWEDACDTAKLRGLTDQTGEYQYQFGLYLNIDNGHFLCTWYENGQPRLVM